MKKILITSVLFFVSFYLYRSVMLSTHDTSVKYYSTIAGIENVWDCFLRSIATGDNTIFYGGVGEMYKRGYKAKEATMEFEKTVALQELCNVLGDLKDHYNPNPIENEKTVETTSPKNIRSKVKKIKPVVKKNIKIETENNDNDEQIVVYKEIEEKHKTNDIKVEQPIDLENNLISKYNNIVCQIKTNKKEMRKLSRDSSEYKIKKQENKTLSKQKSNIDIEYFHLTGKHIVEFCESTDYR